MSDYPTQQSGHGGGSRPPHQPPPAWGQGYGVQPYADGGNLMPTTDSGFFRALFDFKFETFVTPKIVKFVYVLATIGIALGYLVAVGAGFIDSLGAGVLILVAGAVAAVISLAFIRMTLEFYFAIVRMSQDINRRLPRG